MLDFQSHVPAALSPPPPDRASVTSSIGGWVGPRIGPDDARKRYPDPDKIRTQILQSSGL
jgi:hypothetical protein